MKMKRKTIIWLIILAFISILLNSLLFFVLGLMILYFRSKDQEDWITKRSIIVILGLIILFGLEIIIGLGLIYNRGLIP